jgi:superfamily II DNA or RNA helicase/HKD family nuclease
VLQNGLHESLLTETLQRKLQESGQRHSAALVGSADQPHVLSRHVSSLVESALNGLSDGGRLDLTRRLLDVLDETSELPLTPARQLLSVLNPPGPGNMDYDDVRPSTPLSDAALLTNAAGEPSLAHEIRAEIGTSDGVDLLCAFVKWYGLRLLEDPLHRLRERNAPLRVVTTTYLGSTERKALDRLIRDFGATVRIQYDLVRTRLHAKAWLFHRATGFTTAYVGSSNLSRVAMLDGVEWNVRLSEVSTGPLLRKFRATFDTYWNDETFEPYDPDADADRLDDALAEARGGTSSSVTISLSGLEVRPYPFQQAMLDAVDAERSIHDRHRNLVVAATGTGKTVIAALDYRRLAHAANERPPLLFLVHRKEILEQALRTYREVLGDANFGELYVDGIRPERWQHVFASVQSLTAYGVENVDTSAFAIVVIDEFHHAQASTYQRIINHLEPVELLGLTATPERADGVDVREFFGGRIAAELRLWDALGADLLCPFHYFAVADNVDLATVHWKRGGYDLGQLDGLYTGNDARAMLVLRQVRDKVPEPAQMRALGFCVSVAHAEFMALRFTTAGIPARAVTGRTPTDERRQALHELRNLQVNVLFTADLYNEGLDIPDVDTLLMLRPTESATIFLQQLGRGLRRTKTKAVATVLDFVGHQRKEFRFDLKLGALTGRTRTQLESDVASGFPFLPSGCSITLEREAAAAILDNLKTQLAKRWGDLARELRTYGDIAFPQFLIEANLEPADVLRKQGDYSWTKLRRDAGLPTPPGASREAPLLRRARSLSRVDDPDRQRVYRMLLSDPAPRFDGWSPADRKLAQMLFFALWPSGGGFATYAEGFSALAREQAVRAELEQVLDVALERIRHTPTQYEAPTGAVPLWVHAHYQREEILASLGHAGLDKLPSHFREGVVYVPGINTDAFLVTLTKSEAEYSPTTMYRDFPISPTLFHWESQSTTSVSSVTGRRYLSGESTVLLFARQTNVGALGTEPYVFLGPADLVDHSGEKPIAITWKLPTPMPTDFFRAATVVSA